MPIKGQRRIKELGRRVQSLLAKQPAERLPSTRPTAAQPPSDDSNQNLPPAVVTGRELRGLWMPQEQPWAYVVLPKAACTTVGQYLYYVDHGEFYDGDVHHLETGLDRSILVPEVVRGRLANGPVFCFSLVRNPYARLVSAFLDKVLDLEQDYDPVLRRHLVSEWGLQVTGQVDQVANFRIFMQFIEHQYANRKKFQQATKDADSRPTWTRVDPHWIHQTWYLRRARRNMGKVDFIGTIETLNQDLEHLSEHLAPPHVPPLQEMPRFGVGPRREAPLADYYDEETTRILHKIYAPDFDIFGYSRHVDGPSLALDGFARAEKYANAVAEYQASLARDPKHKRQAHENADLN